MVDSIGEELRSFYNFLKNPKQDIFKEYLSVNNFIPIISTYYVVFICGIIVLTPFAALIGLNDMPHKLQDLQDMNKWALLLVAVVTQPFLEELMFRLPLKYHKGLLWLMSTMIGMIIFLALDGVYPSLDNGEIPPMRIAIPTIFVIIVTLLLYTLYREESDIIKIKTYVKKYFPHLFYAVAVYFAYVHFFNFETTGNQWIFTPIMVFPQFLMALFVGYARLKYGFLSAVVIHMINNFVPVMFIL